MNDLEAVNEKKVMHRLVRERGTNAVIEDDDDSDEEDKVRLSRHEVVTATKTLRRFLDLAATKYETVDRILEWSKLFENMELFAASHFNARTVQTKVSSFFQLRTDRE